MEGRFRELLAPANYNMHSYVQDNAIGHERRTVPAACSR